MAEPRVIWVDRGTGVAAVRPVQDLPALRADTSGWLWLDLPEPDEASATWLRDVFALPHTAIQDVLQRNHVSRLYAFGSSLLFLVLHRPEPGEEGHVHYLELDQFIAPDFLITTHGPVASKYRWRRCWPRPTWSPNGCSTRSSS